MRSTLSQSCAIRPLRRALRSLRSAWIALALLLVACPPPVLACRYSVRDTGFVDLDQPPWKLRAIGLSDSQETLWLQSARSRFLDSNLQFQSGPDAQENSTPRGEPATNKAPSPAIELLALDHRSLALARGTELPTQPDAISEFLERVAASSVRDDLHEQLLRSFAVLVLIEGTEAPKNTVARRAAEEAIRAFIPLLGSLPKPVDVPPRLIALPSARIAAERILVWSLGFSPEPTEEPRLAVLFGRGRSLGPPIEGPLITRTALSERLALVGQDCECDLDRSWLQGPVFPARWDGTRQTAAARLLGFDPENPLVRTEVTRIVLRGPEAGLGRRTVTSGLDPLGLGYREESVDVSRNEAADPSEPTTPTETEHTASTTASATPGREVPAAVAPSGEPTVLASRLWLGLGGVGSVALAVGLLLVLKAFRAR